MTVKTISTYCAGGYTLGPNTNLYIAPTGGPALSKMKGTNR